MCIRDNRLSDSSPERKALNEIDRTYLSAADGFTLATILPTTLYHQLLRAIAIAGASGEHLPLTVPKCLAMAVASNRKTILTRKGGLWAEAAKALAFHRLKAAQS